MNVLPNREKIAIIYFDERDAQEFKEYIRELRDENLLLNDLEELDLEALQGVDGLKAIRVGVRIEDVNSVPVVHAQIRTIDLN